MHLEKADRQTIVIAEDDIGKIVEKVGIDQIMDETIETLEKAFIEFGDGSTSIMQRTGFVYNKPEAGLVEFMPSMRGQRRVALKVVGYHPGNPVNRNLPTIIATNSLYDVTNGHMVALVDGTFATAVRTGAASAVASAVFARQGSKVLGVIGNGAQAVTQVHALSRRFSFELVLLHDINDNHTASFQARCSFLDVPMRRVSKEEVVSNSDILIVATSNEVGAEPVVDLIDHKPHLHINAVGSDIPGKVEISVPLLEKALVVPDYLTQCMVEGECQRLDQSTLGPEIHIVLKNKAKFKGYRDELTVFDSTGNPLEDLVITEILYTHAKRLGLGRLMNIESGLYDYLNPYKFH